MTAQLAPAPVFRAWSNLGLPLVGGKLFTYIAGSTTKQATYTDSSQTTTNSNPVILNFRGEAQVWLDPTKVYKLVLAPATDTDPPTNPFWTVDNISGGAASPSFNVIPTVDNLYTLGSTSFSWANVYVGPNHAPILGASGIVGYYPRTAAEIALSVTPTDFSYPADPYVDPRRYGADPTGVADATAAVQTALNVALQLKGCLWIGNNCTYLVGALSLTMATNQSIRIMGSSVLGSKLQAKAGLSATALLTLKSSAPATVLVGVYSQLECFSIQGPVAGITTGVHGLSLQGLDRVEVAALRISGFDRGIDAQNVLTWLCHRQTEISVNNVGINAILVGTIFTSNLWRIHDCQLTLNNNYAISYDKGTGLYVSQCDIENNGTSANFTANPLAGATSGTLTSAWPLITGAYACYFPDGETRTVTLTQGATTATWAGGLANNQTQSWLGTPTGAINVAPTASPDLLEGDIVIENCWFEGNFGGWAVNIQAQSNGNHQRVRISSCEFISSANGQCLNVGGAYFLHLEDLDAETNSAPNIDTFNLTAVSALLQNVFVTNLVDSGITTPWYQNVLNAAVGNKPANGRYDSFTGTLTGCTTSPTATIQVVQQGNEITLIPADLLATSNTTACTITGLPAKYQPTGGFCFIPAIIEDNGVDTIQTALVSVASGTIILAKNGSNTGFTAAGSKGWRRQNLKYRLDL